MGLGPQAARFQRAKHPALSTQGGARCASLPWATLPGTFGAKSWLPCPAPSVRNLGCPARHLRCEILAAGRNAYQPRAALAARACPGLPCPAPSVRNPGYPARHLRCEILAVGRKTKDPWVALSTQGGARYASLPWATLPGTFGAKSWLPCPAAQRRSRAGASGSGAVRDI